MNRQLKFTRFTGRWRKTEWGLTMMEVLLVIGIILLIAIALLVLLNPKIQIEKGWDGKRKKELNTLQKVFEEYYNDKNCYPAPSDVCYDSPQTLSGNVVVCHICGNETASPDFSPYLSQLPCDPQHPTKRYVYEVDNTTCPSYYKVYASLSNENDPSISEAGCTSGCSPSGYDSVDSSLANELNYGVSSSNTSLTSSGVVDQWACWKSNNEWRCEYCCYGADCPESQQCPNLDQQTEYCNIYSSYAGCQSSCPTCVR